MSKQESPFDTVSDWISDNLRKLGVELGDEAETARQPIGQKPTPVKKRVSLIIHNPIVPSSGGLRLNKALKWGDSDALAAGYIADLQDISYGYCNYEIVERVEVDKFPRKQDGFTYKADEFVAAWKARTGFHNPDAVDYDALLDEFDMIEKVNSGAIDEFWLFAFPYAGYYESIMGGPGAFWCNAPPLRGTEIAKRRFVIMGFNYERGVGEMLEDLGHRAESILAQVFERANPNLWEQFTRYDKTHPGAAECGNVHFAPNSLKDYDWGNTRAVPSRADHWYAFPNLTGDPRVMTCAEWGNGDIREHHRWWFRHFPHVEGESGGLSWNWWEYVIDPNRVRV